jgi:hypothetical protein
MLSFYRYVSVFALLAALILSGCAAGAPAATPTLVPTIRVEPSAAPSPTAAPTAAVEETQPYPLDSSMAPENYPYPLEGSAPGGAPLVDNRSRVQATLIEQAPDPENAGITRLRVRVDAVEEIAGVSNLLAGLLHTETDLYARTEILPELKPGESFYAEVTLRGDEKGTKVFVTLFDR